MLLLLLTMTVWISTGSHRHSLFWWHDTLKSLRSYIFIYIYIFVLISMGGIRQNIQIFWWTHKRKSNISSRVYIQQYEKARCIFLLHSDNEVSEVRWTASIPVLEYTDGDNTGIPIVVVAWVTDSPTDACTPPHVHHASCRMNSLDCDETHFVYRWVLLATASDSFYENVILWSITSKNSSTIDNRVLRIGIRNWQVSFVNHFALGLRIYQDGALPPPKKQPKRGVVVVTLVLLLVHNPTANGFYPTSTFYWCTSTSTCLLLGDSTRERKVTLPTERNRVFGVSVDIYFSSLLVSTRIFKGGRINHFHTSCRTRLDHSLHIYI